LHLPSKTKHFELSSPQKPPQFSRASMRGGGHRIWAHSAHRLQPVFKPPTPMAQNPNPPFFHRVKSTTSYARAMEAGKRGPRVASERNAGIDTDDIAALGFRRGERISRNFSGAGAAGNGQFRRGDRLPASFLSCAEWVVMKTFSFVRGSEGQGFSELPKSANRCLTAAAA